MPVCGTCKGLEESFPLSEGIRFQEILNAAEEGCGICRLVCLAVQALVEPDVNEQDLKVAWDTKRIEGLRLIVGRHDSGEFLLSIDMFGPEGHSLPWQLPKYGEKPIEISGDTSSDVARKTITRWLDTCMASHQCLKAKPTYLPSRVLDVRNLDHIYLYCSTPGEEGSYACLSHCWGLGQTLKTTSENLPLHVDAVSLQVMPQTFRDAVSLVSSLGISYLWIDSLCIIQDSKEDWQIESAKMASIYTNSLVTIAASLAAGDTDGLFSKSPSVHHSQLIETTEGNGGPSYRMRVRQTLTHGHGPIPLPLMSRAWVLQERLLSPRVVHFLPEELIWECMENTSCECGCIRFLWSPGHEPFGKNLIHEEVLSQMSQTDIRAQWHCLIMEYSRLELTFNRDRLPAVSGGARKFSRFFQCQYLAGMWRNGFLRDSIWERKSPIAGSKRLGYIPTWSWASIMNAQICVDEAMATEDLAVVLDVACTPIPGSDEFGEISGGSLTLSGILTSISITYHSSGALSVCLLNVDETQVPIHGELKYIPDAEGEKHFGSGLVGIKVALRKGVYSSGNDEEIWLILRGLAGIELKYQRVGLLKVEPGAMEVGEEIGDICTIIIV